MNSSPRHTSVVRKTRLSQADRQWSVAIAQYRRDHAPSLRTFDGAAQVRLEAGRSEIAGWSEALVDFRRFRAGHLGVLPVRCRSCGCEILRVFCSTLRLSKHSDGPLFSTSGFNGLRIIALPVVLLGSLARRKVLTHRTQNLPGRARMETRCEIVLERGITVEVVQAHNNRSNCRFIPAGYRGESGQCFGEVAQCPAGPPARRPINARGRSNGPQEPLAKRTAPTSRAMAGDTEPLGSRFVEKPLKPPHLVCRVHP